MKAGHRARRLAERPLARALAALAVVVVVGCVFHRDGAFFTWTTHRGTLREIAVGGMLACGMTVVVVSGGIDLAVGSVLGLSAVAFALLTMPLGLAAPLAIAVVLAGGALFGAASGTLVARLRLQPFIATLAAMVFARGLAKLLSGGKKVTAYALGAERPHLPRVFELLDTDLLGGTVPVVTLLFAFCVVATHLVLSRMRLGRHLYAVGGNPEAARLAGVPVARTLVTAYAISGLFAAAAGICQAAQETQGDPETGMGYELDAIAMVVIGGTSLAGGRGGVVLTLVGALTIGTLKKILSINALGTDLRLMATGIVVVVAVLFQAAGSRER